jgi:hypothetical protein
MHACVHVSPQRATPWQGEAGDLPASCRRAMSDEPMNDARARVPPDAHMHAHMDS